MCEPPTAIGRHTKSCNNNNFITFIYFIVLGSQTSVLLYIVVSQLESELGGGTEPGEEDVLQVDERCPESAVVEGRHQGPRKHVGRPTQEGGEDVERVECWGQIPLTGGVSDRNGVHHMPWETSSGSWIKNKT